MGRGRRDLSLSLSLSISLFLSLSLSLFLTHWYPPALSPLSLSHFYFGSRLSVSSISLSSILAPVSLST